jgi:hypothetical protein
MAIRMTVKIAAKANSLRCQPTMYPSALMGLGVMALSLLGGIILFPGMRFEDFQTP